ncbi:carboxymuconolactone decarboxylase family protein [Prescottella subtropica]|uniref:carboxymuconolactone decarboxylase family protein n=1 Tax=Prescottella subtropica TaxID=2545757 RepID=UPI0010F583C8|nr:carboxymuconolactone decarboxylase family protein [Prescottella subtropica]
MPTIRMVDESDGDAAGDALSAVVTQRGRGANFYRMYANSPGTLDTACALIWNLWDAVVVDRATIELTILRVSQLVGAEYEWVHHRQMALDAGLSESKIVMLDRWSESEVFSARERALLALVDASVTETTIPPAVVSEFQHHFADDEAVDLFTVIGLYRTIGQMLVGFNIELEPWARRTGNEWRGPTAQQAVAHE